MASSFLALNFKFDQAFFDSAAVAKAVDKTRRKNLSKAGAFVRRSARSSIRKRKRPANPGQPPSSHTGTLKRLIFFAWDFGNQSVVIGPTPFGEGAAPSLLEHGGTVRRKTQRRGNRPPKQVALTYPGHPFMRPAIEREAAAGNILAPWRDSL